MVHRRPFSTTSLSDVDCTINFAREKSWGDRVAVISTAPLDPWMGYVWEVEEDDEDAEKKGGGKNKRKRKREKKISVDRMKRPIIRGSLYKDISYGRRQPRRQ